MNKTTTPALSSIISQPEKELSDGGKSYLLESARTTNNEAMKIVALYLVVKGVKFNNKAEISSAIKRSIRYANVLKGCDMVKLVKIMGLLKMHANFKWTLETAGKYLDDELHETEKNLRHGNVNTPRKTKLTGENIRL